METKLNFKSNLLNSKNITIIVLLSLLFVALLAFGILRDTDKIITHKEANSLFTQNKIKNIILDGEYIHLKTADNSYKIYKDAINKESFFTKYKIEVREESSYLLFISFFCFFECI